MDDAHRQYQNADARALGDKPLQQLADASRLPRPHAVNQNAGNCSSSAKLLDWRDVACFVEGSHDRRHGEGCVAGTSPLLWSCDGIRGSIADGRFHCHRWSDPHWRPCHQKKKSKGARSANLRQSVGDGLAQYSPDHFHITSIYLSPKVVGCRVPYHGCSGYGNCRLTGNWGVYRMGADSALGRADGSWLNISLVHFFHITSVFLSPKWSAVECSILTFAGAIPMVWLKHGVYRTSADSCNRGVDGSLAQ